MESRNEEPTTHGNGLTGDLLAREAVKERRATSASAVVANGVGEHGGPAGKPARVTRSGPRRRGHRTTELDASHQRDPIQDGSS